MDEREQDFKEQTLDLDDILQEFSDEDMKVIPEDTEDILEWDSALPGERKTPVAQDTVRLDQVTREVKTRENLESTTRFAPAGDSDEEEEPIIFQPEGPQVEPYSEDWEPEYEQPIRDYVPQEPLVFRPRNRLQELKRKLVAGPEKRYYELVEEGLGKLQLAILLNFVVAIIAVGFTAAYSLDLISPERMRLAVFIQCLAVMLSALFGSYQLLAGLGDLFRGRFTLDTLLVFSLIACLVDGVLCLQQMTVPCSAVFSLNVTMSLWSAYQRRNTEMGEMDTMRKAVRLNSVVRVPDYHEEKAGFLRGEGQVEDYMDQCDQPSTPEKVLWVYGLICLVLSIALGVYVGMVQGVAQGVRVFTGALLVGIPATAYICLSRPKAILERRLHRLGAVFCGWQGVRNLSRPGYFPLTDADLFPMGTARMNGMKFFGSRDPDEVVAYAAAVIAADGGGMEPLFTQLLDSRSGYHYDVQELRCYENGGLGGIINGEAVLVGNLSFMKEMEIAIPGGTKLSQAVCVAVEGEFCGIFAITYAKVKTSAEGLQTLCSYRKLKPTLVTGDFMLTENFLRGKFGGHTRRMVFLPREVRAELAQRVVAEEDIPLALTTREDFSGAAFAVTGARNLRSASIVGVVIHMLGGILGLGIMLALALTGSIHLISSTNILLYELIWMIPGLLVTEWTRSV